MATKPIFDKKNVLVLGGAGFIGSHLCDELVKKAKVICVDSFLTGSVDNIEHLMPNPDFELIKHDMSQPLDLGSFEELAKFKVEFQGIQEVYDLACPTSPKDFEPNRLATCTANAVGVRNALELASAYQARHMLFSSAVVYGPRTAEQPAVDEAYQGVVDQLDERACYDEGKRFAESLVDAYRRDRSLQTRIVRIFRTYGSRMRLGEGHMVPDFIDAALDGEPLTIFGDESFTSSLCHVSDVVAGVLKVMRSDYGGPVNLGGDREVPLVDVAAKAIELTGSKSEIRHADSLPFMSPLPLPNISLAKEKFGWFPVVRLEDGLEEMIQYIKAERVRVKHKRGS